MALALATIEVVRAPEVPTRRHHRDRRRRDQRDRREPHVEQQERADRERHFEHGEHRDRDGPPNRVGEHRHVARDAADEITGAHAFHEVDRHAERVVEHLGTQFRQRALADDGGAHAAPVPEPGSEEREERVADRGPVDDPRRVSARPFATASTTIPTSAGPASAAAVAPLVSTTAPTTPGQRARKNRNMRARASRGVAVGRARSSTTAVMRSWSRRRARPARDNARRA